MSFQTTVSKLSKFLLNGKEQETYKKKPAVNLTKNEDGSYSSDYYGGGHYRERVASRNEHGYTKLESDLYKYKKGYELIPGSKVSKAKYASLARAKQNEEGRPYSDEAVTDRGMLDRIFGMLGYTGVAEGLYNLVDEDDSTTFGQGLLEGFKYMNPFEDDVRNRNSISDVIKITGMQDEDPDHVDIHDVLRGVVGFGGDIVTDPLSYINPFGAASKVVKGSGYGLDVVKSIEKLDPRIFTLENVKSIAKVADELHNTGKTNIEKLQKIGGIGYETFKEKLISTGVYKDLTDDAFESLAQSKYKDVNAKIFGHRFAEEADEGFSAGLHHLPFMDKAGQALRKTIISNEKLTQFGDKTIAPYYNSLAKKLRTSRIGGKFVDNVAEKNVLTNKWTPNTASAQYIIKDLLKGAQKAKVDANDIKFAEKLSEYTSTLTESQIYDLLQAVEDGTLRDAVAYDVLRQKILDLAGGDVEFADNMANSNGRRYAKNINKRYQKTAEQVTKAKTALDEGQAKFDDLEASTREAVEHLKTNREDVDAGRRLFYILNKKLPGLSAEDTSIEKALHLIDALSKKDVSRTLHNYYMNTGKEGLARIMEKVISGDPQTLDSFISTRLNTMDIDELLDVFQNHGVDVGNVNSKLDAAFYDLLSNDEGALEAGIYKLFEAIDNGDESEVLAELTNRLSQTNSLIDFDGLVDLVVNKRPEGAEIGKFVKKMLNQYPETRKAIVEFGNTGDFIPQPNIFINEFKKTISEQTVDDIIKAHENAIYKGSENLKDLRNNWVELSNKQARLQEEVERFYASDYFKAMREVEKFVSEPGLKTSFVQKAEGLSEDIKLMGELDEKLKKYSEAKKFFLNNDYIKGKKDAEEVYELLVEFETRMSDIANEEVARGLLKEGQVDKHGGKYLLHTLTPEGKEFFGASDPTFTTNGGFKGMVGKGATHDKSRTHNMTIKEANEYFKNNHDVVKAYETDLATIYLSRVLSSNQNIYATDTVNFIVDNFSDKLDTLFKGQKYSDLLEADEVMGVTYHDLNKIINQGIATRFDDESKTAIDKIFDTLCEERLDYIHKTEETNRKLLPDELEELRKQATVKFNKEESVALKDSIRKEFISSFFDGDESAINLYSPNIPIQILNDKTAVKLKELYGITPRKFSKDITNTVNVLSKTQKIAQQKWFTNFYDKWLSIWKLSNTLTAPSFHVQNLASNAFQSFLDIGADAVNPKKIHRAYNILKNRDGKQVFKCKAGTFTHKQLEHIAKTIGVIDEAFISADFGEGAISIFEDAVRKSSLPSFKDIDWKHFNIDEKNVAFQFSTVAGTNIESIQRMNHFLSALEQGKTIEEAAKAVDEYLFNYGELTYFEKETMKRIIPFYTFMRKNIPLQLESILNRPQIYSTLDKAMQNIDKMAGDNYVNENQRNEWRQDYVQLPFGKGKLGINPQLPYQQLDKLDPDRFAGKLIGSMTPAIKVPIEMTAGQYAYTGMPIDSKADYIFSLLGILPSAGYRSITGDKDDVLTNVSKTLAFPMAYVNNMAPKEELTEQERQEIFEAVYGFTPK